MKKYAVKQRLLLAMGDDFDIQDEHGHRLYYVDGKAFSFAEDLAFRDMNRNQLARIRQVLFTFAPQYKILIRGREVARVRKKLFTFRPQFVIQTKSGENYTVVGNLFLHNYKIMRGGIAVARVSKKIISVRDSYGVEINDNEDHVLLLSAAIVIDMVLHNKNKK